MKRVIPLLIVVLLCCGCGKQMNYEEAVLYTQFWDAYQAIVYPHISDIKDKTDVDVQAICEYYLSDEINRFIIEIGYVAANAAYFEETGRISGLFSQFEEVMPTVEGFCFYEVYFQPLPIEEQQAKAYDYLQQQLVYQEQYCGEKLVQAHARIQELMRS